MASVPAANYGGCQSARKCQPTTDGRTVILSRYTELEVDQAILLQRLKMSLPSQGARRRRALIALTAPTVVPTFIAPTVGNQRSG
jgi:hypothetical protein